MVPFRLPDLLLLFSGAVPIVSGQLPAVGGRMPMTRGRVPGNQRPSKSRVCSGWVEGQGPLQHATCGQDPARALHICWPASTQEVQAYSCNSLKPNTPKLQPWICQSKSSRGCIGTWGPPLPLPTEMAPICVNIGDTQWVYHCWVEGCPEGPSSCHATICTNVYHALLGMKLSCPFCPITFFNSNALKWQGKWEHHYVFLCPT